MPVRGVNLGGWLLLEKWMTPDLFDNIDPKATDERSLLELGGLGARAAVARHRSSFIVESDFKWLRQVGRADAVRLPVGFWCLEEHAAGTAFSPTYAYVDQAFDWAETHGLGILLDFHGASGSQNGRDHSGDANHGIQWLRGSHRRKNLEVLVAWSKRWGHRRSFLGLGLCNEVERPKEEPKSGLEAFLLSQFSCDAARSEDYWDDVADFYEEAAKRCRPFLKPDTPLVIDTCWDIDRWAVARIAGIPGPVWVDFHYYECFGDTEHVESHCEARGLLELLEAARIPTIIGEFSLALRQDADGYENEGWQKRFADRQFQIASKHSAGFFFWNYRLAREGWDHWSYRKSVENGWIDPIAVERAVVAKVHSAQATQYARFHQGTSLPMFRRSPSQCMLAMQGGLGSAPAASYGYVIPC